ncbi:MAG TPA: hypothetical protein VGO52_26460 [Hyphomonadaceae bacterium]|jgi:hypothetical protein|nr:hypothetical protein [Hyphomonadaceae bacterium]
MTTISCPGGHTFSDGEIPSPYAWELISEANLEEATNEIISLIGKGGDLEADIPYAISVRSHSTYICPECRRLLVFENGLDKPAASYKRE